MLLVVCDGSDCTEFLLGARLLSASFLILGFSSFHACFLV